MFRFSLREFLVAFLILGVVLATLRIGRPFALGVLICGFIFLIAIAINALVGQGDRKVFSIGFLIPCLAYLAILMASGKRELDPYDGKVPTAELLRILHTNVVSTTYYDMQGNVVTDYDPTVHTVIYGGGPSSFGGLGGGGGGFGGAGLVPAGKTAVSMVEGIERAMFMSIGHGLIALFCGWLGGKYAVFVSEREDRDHALTEQFTKTSLTVFRLLGTFLIGTEEPQWAARRSAQFSCGRMQVKPTLTRNRSLILFGYPTKRESSLRTCISYLLLLKYCSLDHGLVSSWPQQAPSRTNIGGDNHFLSRDTRTLALRTSRRQPGCQFAVQPAYGSQRKWILNGL